MQQFNYVATKTGFGESGVRNELALLTDSVLLKVTPTLSKTQKIRKGMLALLPYNPIVSHFVLRPAGETASTIIIPVICNYDCPPVRCKNGYWGLWLRWNERAGAERMEVVFHVWVCECVCADWRFHWFLSLLWYEIMSQNMILMHLLRTRITNICLIKHRLICANDKFKLIWLTKTSEFILKSFCYLHL